MLNLTQSEKISLSTKDIAKKIRQELKKEFPKCKFSVTSHYFAGGSSITMSLMKSNIRVIKKFDEIPEDAIMQAESRGFSKESIQNTQSKKYHQLSKWVCLDEYKEDSWCNGVYLTKQGHEILRKATQIAEQYNYDNSDPMIDYFDVNFYFHLELGKWDKEFEDGE